MNFPWNSGKTNSESDEHTTHGVKSERCRRRGLRLGIAAGLLGVIAGSAAFAASPSSPFTDSTEDKNVQGPLHTDKANIVDANGHTVTLAGVNWFGFETGTFAPHGLWATSYQSQLDQMVKAGFNTIRLPYSNELFDDTKNTPNGIDYGQNPDLKGLKGLALMDKIIDAATSRGMMVILDQHRPDQYGQSNLWYTSKLSEDQWVKDWVMLAGHYKNNPKVIGADLHNEPHGEATWGDGNPKTDWRMAAEKAGNAVLAANPNWLILVEGIDHFGPDGYWWGGDLQGSKANPVRLNVPNRLVYSPHDYGPGVYNQNWFMDKSFPNNMPGIWEKHWAFPKTEGTTPVLLGEFGGKSVGDDTEGVYQKSLVKFLKDQGISYTYWSWNPDSGDTGGVLQNDWKTMDQGKVDMLQTYQQPVLAAKKK